jgi:CelD/BcsL family acetyltransferase involved in cellulose biosynthesis
MNIEVLTSSDELSGVAREWDALWARNGACLPTALAAQVRLWLSHFAAARRMRAVTVWDDQKLVGGLPLVEQGVRGVMTWGALPNNHWARSGSLLVDPSVPRTQVLAGIVSGLERTPWQAAVFRSVQLDHPDWLGLMEACRAAGWSVVESPLFRAGCVKLDRPWKEWEDSWTSSRRKSYQRCIKRAEKEGLVQLEICDPTDPEEASQLLRDACEIEHRSWKGVQGTSILSRPAVYSYYDGQVRDLARQNCVRFVFLTVNTQRIAFSFHWLRQQFMYSPKIGYDAAYQHVSPGRILEYLHFQTLCQAGRVTLVDFMGPCPQGHEHWANASYLLGNIVVHRPGLRGAVLAGAYRLRRRFKQWRKAGRTANSRLNCDPTEPDRKPVVTVGGKDSGPGHSARGTEFAARNA